MSRGRGRRIRAVLPRLVIAAVVAWAGLWLVAAGAQAQNDPDTSQNPDRYYFQFFGYARDVTIDGEPLQSGDTITPILNGEAVKPAQVQENGFFFTFKHDVSKPAIGDCKVVFVVDSQRHAASVVTEEFMYPKGCGDIQVRLTLSSANAVPSEDAVAVAEKAAEREPDDQDESEDLMQSQAEPSDSEPVDDQMQEGSDGDELDETEDSSQTEAAPERQRPNAPRTGSGGLDKAEAGANWSVVAAMIALLSAIAVGSLVAIRRRRGRSLQ
ncbi:MAG: hypothetical protein OXI41_14755 [Chloroflexota bacterium]|nr:hypothetical protein [Chloroflexota bacterium]MDE2895831.1 hypothetical protein [Chloroflexota bacterium]